MDTDKKETNLNNLNNFSKTNGFCECFMVSVKNNTNVTQSFEKIVKNIIREEKGYGCNYCLIV